MKGKRVLFFFIALSVLLASAFIWSLSAYVELENSLPYLLPGEEPDFDFSSVDSRGVIFPGEDFKKGVVLLFIYRDADRATDNWLIWSSLADLVRKYGVKSYGLIINEGFNKFYYALDKMDKDEWFKVLAPVERNRFLENFRIKYNSSQTLVVKDGEIRMLKFGKLLDDDYEALIREVKSLVEE